MAVTEITKILFRRGREEDRRALEGYGGLAQGEPGFTSAGTGTLGTSPTNTYIKDSNNNIRAGFLNRNDVLDHTNLEDGGGDFFVGGAGGPDIFIGGTSSEKHWQRYFISLYGTKRNCTYDYNEYGEDHDGTGDPSSLEDPDIAGHADWGFINGRMQIGAPLHSGDTNDGNSDTKNHWGDQWDLVCYGPNYHADHGNKMLVGSTNPEQTYFKWDANVGKAEFIAGNAVTIPVGPLSARPEWTTSDTSVTTAEKGDAAFGRARSGDIRYNTEWQTFEGFFDSTIGWGSLGGAISKDRQTYITVDSMGGNDGCPSTSGWVGSELNHINMVIDCEKVVEADTTSWDFKDGIKVNVQSGELDVTDDASGSDSAAITTSDTTFNLLNTNATTVNAFGAATSIDIGAATGTTSINNNLDVDGDVNIDGGDLTTNAATFSIANTNATTVNIGGAAQTVSIGKSDTGSVTINCTSNATNKDTGALIVNGGVGIEDDLYVGGDIVAFATSDQKFKDDVTRIESPLAKLARIDGVEFTWNKHAPTSKDAGSADTGVIAQQVQQVIPSAVQTREDGTLAVDYTRIIPLLVESIKELNTRVEQLEQQ